ncbi:MAG: hypothetical protein QOJ21_2826 [Solirubrobacteraceae bacterium]|nr:hypothetical protein [Solirubrobacteraceae bacterium]
MSVTKEVIAIAITVLVHVLGLVALIWALLMDQEERPDWRGWWPGGDDDRPLDPSPGPQGGGLPLGIAVPSAVRLREPVRIAEAHPRPPRRPAHAPDRERVPQAH